MRYLEEKEEGTAPATARTPTDPLIGRAPIRTEEDDFISVSSLTNGLQEHPTIPGSQVLPISGEELSPSRGHLGRHLTPQQRDPARMYLQSETVALHKHGFLLAPDPNAELPGQLCSPLSCQHN